MVGMQWSRRCAAALMILLLAAATPLAARAQEVLFEDDFSMLDATYGDGNDSLNVENGELFVKLDPNQWWRPFYQSMVFEDADITVKVKLTDLAAEQGSGAGVMFWANHADDMYVLEIGDAGTFCVRRFSTTRILYPVFWRSSDAINADPDAWNELRVVTRGRTATVYINGKEQAKFNGRPPEGGGLVGLFAETGEAAGDEMRYTGLVIKEPEAGEEAPPEDAAVLLSDDFSTLDPGWGSESDSLKIVDGKMVIMPTPDKAWTKFWEGDVFSGDFEASLKLHVNRENEEEYPMGALAFWGAGWDDYWIFYLLPDGSVGVLHFAKTKWLQPMKGKLPPEEAKFDANGMTELKVVTQGRRATFFVNGASVGTVSGMPPKDGGYLGTYNEAAKSGGSIEYDDFVVTRK